MEKGGSKLNPSKNLNPSKKIQTFLSATSGEKIGKMGPYSEEKAPENHFMNAELVCKVLKDFNLTTTNAILIKLITIMYLHEIFNLTKKLGRSS